MDREKRDDGMRPTGQAKCIAKGLFWSCYEICVTKKMLNHDQVDSKLEMLTAAL